MKRWSQYSQRKAAVWGALEGFLCVVQAAAVAEAETWGSAAPAALVDLQAVGGRSHRPEPVAAAVAGKKGRQQKTARVETARRQGGAREAVGGAPGLSATELEGAD